jgi:spoIIIJ-associated protein
MKPNQIEMTGKTPEEAIESALKKLSAARDEVDVEFLDMGSKGILGIGAKPAKVLVTKRFDPVHTAQSFLREMFATMSFSVTPDVKLDGKTLSINLSGTDAGLLIGKKGQVMDSLQYLLSLIINKGDAAYATISLDIENYRQRRKETLENLAVNLAKKVKATRKSSRLEPMSSYERRVIHSALQSDKSITTYSEGVEPYRNVVISLKRDNRGKA